MLHRWFMGGLLLPTLVGCAGDSAGNATDLAVDTPTATAGGEPEPAALPPADHGATTEPEASPEAPPPSVPGPDAPGESLVACSSNAQAVSIDPNRALALLGGPPADLARQLVGSLSFESDTDGNMTIELGAATGIRERPDPCGGVLIDVPARVYAGDELIASVTATFDADFGPFDVFWKYTSDDPELESLDLLLLLDGNGVARSEATVRWHGQSTTFAPTTRIDRQIAQRFEPAAAFEELCASVREMPYSFEQITPFADSAQLSAALDGTWIWCDGPSIYDFSGFVIEGDQWHSLTLGESGLEPRYGLGYEGNVRVAGPPDLDGYQIDLRGPGWGIFPLGLYPEGLRAVINDANYEPLQKLSFVRAPVPVAAASELPFAARERAGAAACNAPQQGVLDVSSSLRSVLDTFQGHWVRCSGALPSELEIDADGSVHALADGAVLENGALHFPNGFPDTFNLPGTIVLNLDLAPFSNTYDVAFSERPLQLSLRTTVGGVGLVSVYSAAP